MLHRLMDRVAKPLGRFLHKDHMRRLGIARTMRIAQIYNGLRYRRHDRLRRSEYEQHMDRLLSENGPPGSPPPALRDGWFLDTSMSHPMLPTLLEQSAEIIRQRGGVSRPAPGTYRSFFRNIVGVEDCATWPALLDLALSSELLAVVSGYLKCVPVLSGAHPEGIRLAESRADFDDDPDHPHDSQLFHIDYYAKPNVYAIVLLEDVTPEHGPFCFLPASVSQQAAEALGYWSHGKPYRLSDQDVYAFVDHAQVIALNQPRGTILYIDPSLCFHYGSRNSVKPRYQLMIGYTTAVRTDFSEFYLGRRAYRGRPGDCRLRRMVLDREFLD
jgi:hypothetical protein